MSAEAGIGIVGSFFIKNLWIPFGVPFVYWMIRKVNGSASKDDLKESLKEAKEYSDDKCSTLEDSTNLKLENNQQEVIIKISESQEKIKEDLKDELKDHKDEVRDLLKSLQEIITDSNNKQYEMQLQTLEKISKVKEDVAALKPKP